MPVYISLRQALAVSIPANLITKGLVQYSRRLYALTYPLMIDTHLRIRNGHFAFVAHGIIFSNTCRDVHNSDATECSIA